MFMIVQRVTISSNFNSQEVKERLISTTKIVIISLLSLRKEGKNEKNAGKRRIFSLQDVKRFTVHSSFLKEQATKVERIIRHSSFVQTERVSAFSAAPVLWLCGSVPWRGRAGSVLPRA